MLNQVKKALQKTNANCNLLFPGLYYYYDMKLVSLTYDKDFNLLLPFPAFAEPYTQKPLALFQLETVTVSTKDNNTELYTWLQPGKNYLAMTEENYISLTSAELNMCEHIGHEYFCKTIFWSNIKHHKVVNQQYFLSFPQYY